MARSQRPIIVKLNHDQIDVLDKVVEYGEFNGRSHALRELVLPALNAGVSAMNSGSRIKAMYVWIKEMETMTNRMDNIAKNSQKGKQEDFDLDLDIPPMEVQPV